MFISFIKFKFKNNFTSIIYNIIYLDFLFERELNNVYHTTTIRNNTFSYRKLLFSFTQSIKSFIWNYDTYETL